MRVDTTNLPRVVALIAATSLCLASAGFAALYAYNTGIQHGIALAGLSVLFAVSLEAVKPLAIQSALQAIGSLSLVRGLCLAALGLVAVAYSLTAELTLMAGARGDTVAQRQTILSASKRYEAAQTELATLGPGSKTRRSVLEAVPMPQGHQVGAADPGATALATYLAALGIVFPVALLTEWLALVPVLALELGSALAAVLVASVTGSKPMVQAVVQPVKTGDIGQTILAKLKEAGGKATSSERGLAKVLGTSKPTLRRAIHSLSAAGLIALEASRNGTILRLVS